MRFNRCGLFNVFILCFHAVQSYTYQTNNSFSVLERWRLDDDRSFLIWSELDIIFLICPSSGIICILTLSVTRALEVLGLTTNLYSRWVERTEICVNFSLVKRKPDLLWLEVSVHYFIMYCIISELMLPYWWWIKLMSCILSWCFF